MKASSCSLPRRVGCVRPRHQFGRALFSSRAGAPHLGLHAHLDELVALLLLCHQAGSTGGLYWERRVRAGAWRDGTGLEGTGREEKGEQEKASTKEVG
eukprot:scaffold12427_cov79-Isochrysis_galbana.AAC.1